jgi:hypothetical protein
MISQKNKNKDDLFATRLWANMGESLIAYGVINPEGKSDEDLFQEIWSTIEKLLESDSLPFVIDHTDDLLGNARLFKKRKKNSFAILFYALWVEHQLNDIIAIQARKSNLTAKEIDSLVRETSYKAKCSWLLRLTGGKPFTEAQHNSICKLMDLRNSFVHYKWKPENEQMEKEIVAVVDGADKIVNYIRRYKNKHVFGNHKKKVYQIAKKYSSRK